LEAYRKVEAAEAEVEVLAKPDVRWDLLADAAKGPEVWKALFAAAILRRNPDSILIPFDDRPHKARVDPGDTILSLAERLARYGGGGTNCALPLQVANATYRGRRFDGVILVSDQESWIGTGRHNSTGVMTEWQTFVANQVRLHERGWAGPKLVCIDLQTYITAQAPDRSDILNVGGFSDAVPSAVATYLAENASRFVAEVEAIEL
jgi:60 kDa SS-A/Ro ribonucleoprotein